MLRPRMFDFSSMGEQLCLHARTFCAAFALQACSSMDEFLLEFVHASINHLESFLCESGEM